MNSSVTIPVVDVCAKKNRVDGHYSVQPGETLYFIAWRLNIDYRELANFNRISAPYILQPGQKLRLTQQARSAKLTTQVSKPNIAVIKKGENLLPLPLYWQWPVKGRLLKSYASNDKGIDIIVPWGTLVQAAASGEVIYSGNQLRGYGNLIIIKHDDQYMSAYAHNDEIMAHEGTLVKAGQMIAKIGSTALNAKKTCLHFEIRKMGKAVNPLLYLK